MVQSIMGLKDRALRRYIAVVLMSVVLSAALLGCTAATEPPIAQEAPNVEVPVPITPPEVPEEVEADSPEQDVEVVAANDIENITTEFVPDWDAITQRVDELVEFFTSNLIGGITLEDVVRELDREPTFFSFHDSDDMTRIVTTYGFDLLTGPSFTPLNRVQYEGIDPEAETHNAWLMSGYIGMTVMVQIAENEDNTQRLSIARGGPNKDRWHNISISAPNNEVIVSVSTHYLR